MSFLFFLIFLIIVVDHAMAPTGGCFHGSDVVDTAEFGPLTIEELVKHPEANVLTAKQNGNLVYSSVKYWLHSNPIARHSYLRIQTTIKHRPLLITPEHLIYAVNENATDRVVMRAEELKVGDHILVLGIDSDGLVPSPIVRITPTERNGIYAPITNEGSIIVNGVLASSYTIFKNEYLQGEILDAVFRLHNILQFLLPSEWLISSVGDVMKVPQLAVHLLDMAESLIGHQSVV